MALTSSLPFARGRWNDDHQQNLLSNLVVRDELANKMSYFLAVPTPMLNAIVGATTNFVGSVRALPGRCSATRCALRADPAVAWGGPACAPQNNVPQDNVLEVLSTMAAICHNAVHDPERAARYVCSTTHRLRSRPAGPAPPRRPRPFPLGFAP